MDGWMYQCLDGLLEGWVEEKDRLLSATRPHLATGRAPTRESAVCCC